MATGRLPDPNTAPLTAKGDLYTYSTVPARLAVGSNGDTLVADSSTSTGLRWQSSANLNGIINGGMDIWQRGTSFALASTVVTYTADRWCAYRAATGSTVSRQTASLDGFDYSIRVQRDSGNTSTSQIQLVYNMETVDSVRYANKPIVLSFWAKAGANYSAASSRLGVTWRSGTGTNQNLVTGYTGAANLYDSNITLTTSWQRFSFTATPASTATQIGVQLYWDGGPLGTAGANDWFEITGVQIEYGAIPTTFKRAGNTLAGELAACQRYYLRLGANSGGTTSAFAEYGLGFTTSTTNFRFLSRLLPMRVAPTSVEYANLIAKELSGTSRAISAIAIQTVTNSQYFASLDITIASSTSSAMHRLENDNNTGGYLAFSAEL